ncbi:MAG: carbohydrate-binding domain-containing protein [Anaerolineaceae bacterium]
MKKIFTAFITLLLILTMAACSSTASVATTSAAAVQTNETAVNSSTQSTTVDAAVTAADLSATHESAEDYTWDSASEVAIALNNDSITVSGEGAAAIGSIATITSAGSYRISGTLADGQIVVDTADEGTVRLILDSVNISNSTSAAINVVNAKKVVIVLADNSQNLISDASTYVYSSAEEDEPNAAIFSTADLTFYGNGSLTVNGNSNDGIASKDGLLIESGNITINAADDGIRGKDYLVVKSGSITVQAGGDGLKSDNDEDASKGYILVESGTLNITAGADGLDAVSNVLLNNGDFTINTGGGSIATLAADASAKGIKSDTAVTINNGTYRIDSADDAVHANVSLVVNGGSFSIATGDDGMHSDATLTINSGDIQITQSYEGIESAAIIINDGNIHIISSDDGINGAGGVDGSGTMQGFGGGMGGGGTRPGNRPGGQEQGTPPDGAPATNADGTQMQPPAAQDGTTADQMTLPNAAAGANMDTFAASGSISLTINGGTIVIDANGDGIDVNGSIEMTDGLVLVNGPTNDGNSALDFDSGFNISGGLLVAVGSSGMAHLLSATSTQNSVLVNLSSAQSASTLINVQNSAGESIMTFSPTKNYQSLMFSSPNLVTGSEYTVSVGGSSTGDAVDNLYTGGAFSGGTSVGNFTISSVVTLLGSEGRR